MYMYVNVHPIETTVCKICGNTASQANFSIHYNNTEILQLLQNCVVLHLAVGFTMILQVYA